MQDLTYSSISGEQYAYTPSTSSSSCKDITIEGLSSSIFNRSLS